MTLRTRITEALKSAMKAREADRLSTLRMITAAITEREIALRGEGTPRALAEDDILAVLARMVKARQESARAYEAGNRPDLAARELAEVAVIGDFLPKQLSEAETGAAIAAVIAELGAGSIRDMGRVMAELKARYTGQIDFARAGAAVKARLGA